jgi:hypothetical protein
MKNRILKTELISWRSLEWLQNPNLKEMKKEEFERLKNSLKKNDFIQPFNVWDEAGKIWILDGHHRKKALEDLEKNGIFIPDLLPASFVECQNRKDAVKLILVYSSIYANVTEEGLYELMNIEGLQLAEFDDLVLPTIDLKKFEQGYFDQEPQDAEPQLDRAEELNKKWQVKTGDLWKIGEHRLLCGDSKKREDIERVIQGERAFVFSDPPYGIDVVKGRRVGGGGSTKFGKVGENWVDSHEYPEIIGDETTETARLFYSACLEIGIKDFILWGGNYFTDFLPVSRCWLVWDKQNTGNFADVELAWTSFDKSAKKYEWLWNGLSREGNRKDELKSRIHPTQKPVGLAVNIMKDFPAEIYLDGFSGSGSFMVASQNIGKRMIAIEKGIDWCAVILERMATAFPGIEIKRL